MWSPGHVFVGASGACALVNGALKALDDTALIYSGGLYEGCRSVDLLQMLTALCFFFDKESLNCHTLVGAASL